jgi:hypothetical protein
MIKKIHLILKQVRRMNERDHRRSSNVLLIIKSLVFEIMYKKSMLVLISRVINFTFEI